MNSFSNLEEKKYTITEMAEYFRDKDMMSGEVVEALRRPLENTIEGIYNKTISIHSLPPMWIFNTVRDISEGYTLVSESKLTESFDNLKARYRKAKDEGNTEEVKILKPILSDMCEVMGITGVRKNMIL